MQPHELPRGAVYGMKYQMVVITLRKSFPWLRERFESREFKFVWTRVTAFRQLCDMSHDVLINATEFGAE